MKTLSDPERGRVNLDPKDITLTARARNAIIGARKTFVAACGKPTARWKPLGAVGRISGVGFWEPDPPASNALELQPVTGLELLPGCGS